MEDWIDLGKVNAKRKDGKGNYSHNLYMKIIDGEKYYKVNGEHVKVLDKMESSVGFTYNAISPSYLIYIV